MTENYPAIRVEAEHLAQQLFKEKAEQRIEFVDRLMDIYNQAQGKDILVIHSPGGWGRTDIEHLIWWERSVVEGMRATLTQLGYEWVLIQYFRSGKTWRNHLRDTYEQVRYLFTGKIFKAEVLAAEVKLLSQHLKDLRIVLLGVSQGAAFNNTVMHHLDQRPQVYSIELGIFFAQLHRRVITERTLAIDSNGLVPDPVVHRNLKASIKAYVTAPFNWAKYRLAGKPVKFTHCVNVPGHEYRWEYPNVGHQIKNFLENNLGYKNRTNLEKNRHETGKIH